jgi:hypothetical protein
MIEKPRSLFKTKTFWAGLASIMTGIGLIVNGELATGLELVAGGIVAITLRDGIRKAEI